jgi:DNA repair exonuclease SbcCD ATPase subunit
VSDKMVCPGCESYTSGVLAAFREGRACPVCGLSAEAAQAVEEAQARHADEVVTKQLTDALKQMDELKRESDTLRYRLNQVERALTTEPPRW